MSAGQPGRYGNRHLRWREAGRPTGRSVTTVHRNCAHPSLDFFAIDGQALRRHSLYLAVEGIFFPKRYSVMQSGFEVITWG